MTNTGARWSRSRLLLQGASALAVCMSAPVALAQDDVDETAPGTSTYNALGADDEIIVTGIRGSYKRAQDIKRAGNGVVDAISAEDIGKFPDTNLAESLQRISGVAINRVNGEGSQVTVRGFGAEFNLVTLNGRSLPGADAPIVGGDRTGGLIAGNTRAFDFSNIASEAVSGIAVYKTGQAIIASGGIGATVDIQTARPLDNGPGFTANFGGKGVFDTSAVSSSGLTPEFNGIVSWTDPSESLGVSLFGSFQQRDSSAASASVFVWQTFRAEDFLNDANFVNADTVIVNAPTDPDQLVGIAIDSRLHFSDFERERLNFGGVVQYAPSENLTITVDGIYARNDNSELRSDIANWFGQVFTEVIFDTGQPVATAQSLSADFTVGNFSGNKDYALEQDTSATRDQLQSIGLNFDWQATDNLRFVLDGHMSRSQVTPNQTSSILGDVSRVTVAAAAPFVTFQTQTFLPGQAPVQFETLDTSAPDGVEGFSITDVSSTFQQGFVRIQDNDVNEVNLRGEWDVNDFSKFQFGINYRDQENFTFSTDQQQFLGFFDGSNPGDIAQFAPGILNPFCLTCQFNDFEVGAQEGDPSSLTFRPNSGADLIRLFDTLSPVYANAEGTPDDLDPRFDNSLNPPSTIDSTVEERITSLFGQYDSSFEVSGFPVRTSIGVRYEWTDVTSRANFTAPLSLTQTNDNDFILINSTESIPLAVSSSYQNFLPHANFAVDVTDDVVFRGAYSRTIARAGFGQLSAQVAGVGAPNGGPSALGFLANANQGNPGLEPLISDNLDASVEWYYDDASFISVGYFWKSVDNFIGQGATQQVLFPNLADPTSGAPGSRSGIALDLLGEIGANINSFNLFVLTSLVDDFPVDQARMIFEDNLGAGGDVNLDSVTAAALAAGGDVGGVTGDANDAPLNFLVNQPINNETATIQGLEFAAQHFFGDTGFGIAGSYTIVDSNVNFDVTVPNGADQFALFGLSDTANITGIYEKYGVSARLSYNWRGEFLQLASRDFAGTPLFVTPFGQLDLNVSYNVTDNFIVSFEGINILGENFITRGRTESQVVFAQELAPRYLFGVRYKF